MVGVEATRNAPVASLRVLPWLAAGQRSAAPPRSEHELLERAHGLAGCTVGDLAARFGVELPPRAAQAKGLAGELVERALGADAGSAPEPDFAALGIELKTIPLDRAGRPRESTFVAAVRLGAMDGAEWEASPVRRKLARVLWVPLEADPALALAARRLGSPRLWSPSCEEEAALRRDWEELAGMIARGDVEQVTAHVGRYLQIRPKAADARARVRGVDGRGAPLRTLPRGFYLRRMFTARIFA